MNAVKYQTSVNSGSLQLVTERFLWVAYENEARGLKILKKLVFSRCKKVQSVMDVNNPNLTGCNVKETISVLKFPQVQGSLQLARKVAPNSI